MSVNGIYFKPEDGTGSGGGTGDNDNHQIRQMRSELEKAQVDAKKAREEKETLAEQLKGLQRSQMDELQKTKAEKEDLAKQINDMLGVKTQLDGLNERHKNYENFISDRYATRLNDIPENRREEFKLLTLVPGDPIESLKKLDTAISILGGGASKQAGSKTNPGGQEPDPTTKKSADGSNNDDGKFDPSKITWNQALRPKEEIIQERDNLRKLLRSNMQ